MNDANHDLNHVGTHEGLNHVTHAGTNSGTNGAALREIAAQTVERATAAGADSAEALVVFARELTAKVRLGEPELVQQAQSRALGLRVIREGRQAVCHTADLTEGGLGRFVQDTVHLARLAEPDPDAGPPAPEALASELTDLALYDEAVEALDADLALELAQRAEQAARDTDPQITNSEGAACSASVGGRVLATSGGFCGSYQGTYLSLVVEPVADDEGGKKRNGFWWDGRRFKEALEKPEAIGREAARRAVDQLGARKVGTRQVPVIFSPEAGAQVLRTLFGLVSGDAAYRRATYLLERAGTEIAATGVTVVDDPLLPGGPGSRPFDGEGLPTRRNVVVDAGRFTGFLCDTYAGRRLGLRSTASAGRSVGSPPAVTASNFFLRAGDPGPDELERSTPQALYVRRMMGFGFNPVTGDFSKGAEGFWIEDGQRVHPVSEVTISANFEDLLRSVDAVADDLDHRSTVSSPTFRVSKMTVAGS
jgi:PmbA protein